MWWISIQEHIFKIYHSMQHLTVGLPMIVLEQAAGAL